MPPILNTAPSAAALLSPAAALSPSALLSPAAAAVVDAESEPPHAVKDAAITTAKPALKNLFFIIVSSSHDCI